MVLAEDLGAQLAQSRKIRPTFGYYRQPNGWITVQTITRMERIKRIEKGYQYLEKYGSFDMSPYVANHPFEALFMFGGVEEMPAEQVIQTGLYIDPPLVPTCRQHLTQYHRGHTQACWYGAKRVQFTQLAHVQGLGPFPCAFCPRELPTIQARDQHQSVAHKEEAGDLRTGTSLGTSLAEALNTKSQVEQELAELKEQLNLLLEERTTPSTSSGQAPGKK